MKISAHTYGFLLVCFSCLAWSYSCNKSFGQEPLTLNATKKDDIATYEQYQPIRLTITKPVPDGYVRQIKWVRKPDSFQFLSIPGDPSIIDIWAPPGVHEIAFDEYLINWDARDFQINEFSTQFRVLGDRPTPPTPPDPDNPDPDNPDPDNPDPPTPPNPDGPAADRFDNLAQAVWALSDFGANAGDIKTIYLQAASRLQVGDQTALTIEGAQNFVRGEVAKLNSDVRNRWQRIGREVISPRYQKFIVGRQTAITRNDVAEFFEALAKGLK